MLRVGLTGGIACGKSRVLRRLEAHGCSTLDLDRVAHEVMAPGGPAYDDVVAAFGPGVLGPGGSVDRKALGAVVFGDDAARRRLNEIVHPRVRVEERRRMESPASAAAAVGVVDAALLVESGLHLRFDRQVVVHCAPEQQLQRLMARDGLSREQAAARIRAQLDIDEKRRFAHFQLDSSGTLEQTDAAADALARELRALAQTVVKPVVAARDVLARQLERDASQAERQASRLLLEDVASAGGIEMPRVAALLGRPRGRPWLAANGEPCALRPSALVVPVAAWSLARRGEDDELLGLAALSLARTLTADPEPIADACAAALRCARVAAGRTSAEAEQAAFARRWSGQEPKRPAPGSVDSRGEPEAATLAALDRFLAAAAGWASGPA